MLYPVYRVEWCTPKSKSSWSLGGCSGGGVAPRLTCFFTVIMQLTSEQS